MTMMLALFLFARGGLQKWNSRCALQRPLSRESFEGPATAGLSPSEAER